MNYCEEKGISTSKLNEAQRTLYYIAENMKMDKSISEEGYEHFQQAIKALEEQEPRIGHWVQVQKTTTYSKWKCSECGMLVSTSQTPWYKYCPMCGLKMIESQESENKELDEYS